MKKSSLFGLLCALALAAGIASAGPPVDIVSNDLTKSAGVDVNKDNSLGGTVLLRVSTYPQVAIMPAGAGNDISRAGNDKATNPGPLMLVASKHPRLVGSSPPPSPYMRTFLNYTNESAEGDMVNRRQLLRATSHGDGPGSGGIASDVSPIST